LSWLHRRLIGGVDDRPCTVAFVEFKPVGVAGSDLWIGTERRIVRQALKIKLGAERARLLAHPFIERGADAPARAAKRGRDDLEIREADIRRVQQERHAKRLVTRVLGNKQARDEAMLERIGKLLRQFGDIVVRHRRELLAHDLLRRLDCGTVGRGRSVGHFADAQHATCEACQRRAGKALGAASTILPINSG
jgi:hypothetical protein